MCPKGQGRSAAILPQVPQRGQGPRDVRDRGGCAFLQEAPQRGSKEGSGDDRHGTVWRGKSRSQDCGSG